MDDAKLLIHILHKSDIDLLQKDLLDVQVWLDKWLSKLNIQKCKVVLYTQRIEFMNDYCLHSEGSIFFTESFGFCIRFRWYFDCKLNSYQINEKVKKAYYV